MDIFKNKYYKVFPLSIFITQCTDSDSEDEEEENSKEVKFEEDHIKFYKSSIKFDEGGNVKEETNSTFLFSNSGQLSVNRFYKDIHQLIECECRFKNGECIYDAEEVRKKLRNYTSRQLSVTDKDGNSYSRSFNDKRIFFDNCFYKFYLFLLLEKKIVLKNKSNQTIEFNFRDNVTTYDVFGIAKKFKTENFTERIFRILTGIYKDFNSKAEKIIKIGKKEIDHKNDKNNLKTYIDFLEALDKEGEKIEIVIDDHYGIKVTDVLLSDNLSKTYNINTDAKAELEDSLNKKYLVEKKYSKLQEALNEIFGFSGVKIQNGDTDKDIENLDNVTITITYDPLCRIIVPKKCTIKFEPTNGLFITDNTNYPASKDIEFSDGGITTDTDIDNYIKDNYKGINGKCTITPTKDNSGKFEDGTVVTVTINGEIEGITTKKDPNQVYVNVTFKVSFLSDIKLLISFSKTDTSIT